MSTIVMIRNKFLTKIQLTLTQDRTTHKLCSKKTHWKERNIRKTMWKKMKNLTQRSKSSTKLLENKKSIQNYFVSMRRFKSSNKLWIQARFRISNKILSILMKNSLRMSKINRSIKILSKNQKFKRENILLEKSLFLIQKYKTHKNVRVKLQTLKLMK